MHCQCKFKYKGEALPPTQKHTGPTEERNEKAKILNLQANKLFIVIFP